MCDITQIRHELAVGRMVFLDSETVGLYGQMVLLQFAVDSGPIHLYDVWKEPVWKTLELLEQIAKKIVVMFNAVFDWFHISKLATIWRLLPPDWIPEENINAIAELEPRGCDGPCLKPASALDLMLYGRRTSLQSLMQRGDIRVRRVPTVLAGPLAEELERRVEIDDIYFARSANPDAPRWTVDETKDPEFSDVTLRFKAAGGLKFLADHVLGYKPKYHFKDVEPQTRPYELGYAPYAKAVSSREKGWAVETDKGTKYAWPAIIQQHINHWATNKEAREYALDDIVYTRGLYEHWNKPDHGDDDSVLACAVAAIRWRGYIVDLDGIRECRREAEGIVASAPCDLNKPDEIRAYLGECLDELEALTIDASVAKPILKLMTSWMIDEEECSKCCGGGCHRCGFTGKTTAGEHPVVSRVVEILKCKSKLKEINLLRKLEVAGRFHADFKVIGTLSSRMSGSSGLNAQGVPADNRIRKNFIFKREGEELSLGDFWSFEVCLAESVYNDDQLRADLLSGKKLHALFAMALFPGMTYEDVIASAGTENDAYTKGKQGVFGGIFYGGNENTLVKRLGVTPENAAAAFQEFSGRYPGVGVRRKQITNMFSCLRQPAGIGSAIYWHEPADSIDNGLGFHRYFTLENKICRALFDLARSVPSEWRKIKVKVVRRDRLQTASGAVASALYGAAFAIQGCNIRAAANHEIQSRGAVITKYVQRKVWDLQPAGVHEFVVAPCNIHDEIVTPVKPEYVDRVTEVIRESVENFRPSVALIGIDWCPRAESWAEKKAGGVSIRPEGMER